MEISNYVKTIRKKLGLTRREFAELLNSNRFNIYNYEKKRAIPPGDVLLKIQELDPGRKAA